MKQLPLPCLGTMHSYRTPWAVKARQEMTFELVRSREKKANHHRNKDELEGNIDHNKHSKDLRESNEKPRKMKWIWA